MNRPLIAVTGKSLTQLLDELQQRVGYYFTDRINLHYDAEFKQTMDGLYKIYKRVTPAIKEMIKGKEVQTPDGLFRLKFSAES